MTRSLFALPVVGGHEGRDRGSEENDGRGRIGVADGEADGDYAALVDPRMRHRSWWIVEKISCGRPRNAFRNGPVTVEG